LAWVYSQVTLAVTAFQAQVVLLLPRASGSVLTTTLKHRIALAIVVIPVITTASSAAIAIEVGV
jgi:hypothetical protein